MLPHVLLRNTPGVRFAISDHERWPHDERLPYPLPVGTAVTDENVKRIAAATALSNNSQSFWHASRKMHISWGGLGRRNNRMLGKLVLCIIDGLLQITTSILAVAHELLKELLFRVSFCFNLLVITCNDTRVMYTRHAMVKCSAVTRSVLLSSCT